MTDKESRNLAIITEVCDAFNRHDVDGIVRHLADDAVWLVSRGAPPDGGTYTGLNTIRDMIARRFRTIPDMAWEIHSHWVGGDRGCSEWTVSGTESNGNRLNWLGCDLWALREDGKIVKKDTYWKYSGEEAPE